MKIWQNVIGLFNFIQSLRYYPIQIGMAKLPENRRRFLSNSGLAGIGLLGLSLRVVKSSSLPATAGAETGLERLKWWLGRFFTHDGKAEKGEEACSLVEKCGKDCAGRGSLMAFVRKMRAEAKDPSDLHEMLGILKKNQFGENLSLDGNTISLSYSKCYCTIRTEGYITSPVFCNCSKGWVKTVYEELLQKPVEVKLTKAISRGDQVCAFEVTA